MRTLSRIQALVGSSALLRTAIQEGSLQVVYRQPPTISADRLTVTWRVDVLLLDPALTDVAAGAMRRLGFTVTSSGELLRCVQDFLLSAADRAELDSEDRERQQQAAAAQQQAQQQATAATITELQEQIEALRDELELLRLKPGRAGRPGAPGQPGPQGPPGPAGRDLLATAASLGDLQDVSDQPADQGQVLTWDQGMGQWEPKSPRMALASIGGAVGLQHWRETESGDLLPLDGDKVQSLGSAEAQLKEVWVSGGTVYLDQRPLEVNQQARLTWDGNVLAYGSGAPADADGGLITTNDPNTFT